MESWEWVKHKNGSTSGYLFLVQVQSPVNNLPHTVLVKDLLVEGGTEWNNSLILDTFWLEEAETVLQIRISKRGGEHKLIWGLKTKGVFSLKSTYHVAIQKLREERGETSVGSEEVGLWKNIWDLDVPQVDNFLWKANTNNLPTRQNLCTRNVINEGTCLICQQDIENVIHTL